MAQREDPAETRVLLARAREGDRAALEEAFARVRPELERWVALRFGPHLRRRLDVDDILQETLMSAYGALESLKLEAPGDFAKWLRKVADNRIRDANDYFRAKKRAAERERPLAEPARAGGTSPSEAAARADARDRLLETLATLPEADRDIIRLVRLEGRSYAEAGEILGITAKNAGVRLVRALQALRARHGDAARPTRW